MALHGPPYLGLLNERAKAVEQITRMGTEAATVNNDWSIAILDARSDLLEGIYTSIIMLQISIS